jgi:hypothetical protein
MTLCCRLPRQSGNAHLQLADVLRAAVPGLAARQRLPAHHWKTLHALLRCHTPALGGHLYGCAACGKEHFVPHSCRNRHCPGCQRAQADDWLERQQASLLPVSYFHVVFTLPHVLNHMISQNQRELYKLLFDSASATLLTFGEARLQAQIGVTAVLHTWSQTLLDHYHLHCVVTGGGLSLHDQQWRSTSSRYLFPVRALSKVFRGKFLNGLQKLYEDGKLRFYGALAPLAEPPSFTQLLRAACATEWVVYSKQPFAGPRAVLAYLSRYTHRVAIGPGRLRALDPRASTVTFTYKDYADAGRRKKMQLKLTEFLRRFCLHILPPRFVKIRHYGLLGNRHRTSKVAAARLQLTAENRGTAASIASRPSSAPVAQFVCPHCGSGQTFLIARLRPAEASPSLLDSS